MKSTDKERKEITRSLVEACDSVVNSKEEQLDEEIDALNEAGEWIDAWAQKEFLTYGIGAVSLAIMFGVVAAQIGIAKAKEFFKGLKNSEDPKAELKKKIGKDFDKLAKGK
jgi:hypothetical protein